jgi:hypothetical protein
VLPHVKNSGATILLLTGKRWRGEEWRYMSDANGANTKRLRKKRLYKNVSVSKHL